MQKATKFDLPAPGEVNLFVLTDSGVLLGRAHESKLRDGTDPLSAASALRLEFHLESGIASLRFFALSNHAYSVEYKVDLGNPAWLPLTNLSAATSNRTAVVPVLTEGPASFYRLVTPARP